ncbi:MAG: FecR family protein [Spirochaetota bacterium]|nr:FecR family protein [Spirochaetota bacterium]
MKLFNLFYIPRISFIITLSIAFYLLSYSIAQALQVSFSIGNVSILREGDDIGADIGTKVVSGDTIVTGKGGLAELAYMDGSKIKVLEKTSIKIGSKHVKDSDSVSVISGVVRAKFAKLKKKSVRKVYSPTSVCAVRGTDFLVGVSSGADSKVQMTKGKLDVYNPYGKVKIKGKQSASIGVAKNPQKEKSDKKSIKDWKKKKDDEFVQNPGAKGKSFEEFIKEFNKRSSKASQNIDKLEDDKDKAGSIGKKKLESKNKEIDKFQKDVADDLMLNEAANGSLDGILNKFKKDKEGIYNQFLKIKEESNKVLEQQRRNHEAIMAVKEAYQKAYNEIMGKHRNYMNKLKGGFDKEKYKPKKD